MNGHSWCDKKKKKAILLQGAGTPFCRKSNTFSHTGKIGICQSHLSANWSFMVGKAYNEPQGITGINTHIEDILLQRDFIID